MDEKKRQIKSSDPYLSSPSSNWITKLVNAGKTRKEILFIPWATIPSKSTRKKIHAPDWLITSTITQFGVCPTSSGADSKQNVATFLAFLCSSNWNEWYASKQQSKGPGVEM